MSGRGFVKLHREHFPAYCQQRQIPLKDRAVFEHLILEADWRTGIIEGFTLTHCSREIGLGTSSGRRTLELRIRRLCQLGVIDYEPSAGGLPGTVTIVDFHTLGRPEPRAGTARRAARSTRGERAALPPIRARETRADRPEHPSPPAASRTEEVPLGVEEKLASERAESSNNKDWRDDELEMLLASLVDFCRDYNKLGLKRRGPVLAALSPFCRSDVERLVAGVLDVCRKDGSIYSPIGTLVATARAVAAGDAPMPAARVVRGPVPNSSFGRELIDRSDLNERYGD